MNKMVIAILVAGVGLSIGGIAVYVGMNQMGINKSSSDSLPIKSVVEETSTQEERPVGGMPDETSSGEELAGTSSFYYTFTKSAYEEALQSDKLVFLNFYADWCPICRVEEPDIEEGFNKLERDDVIGFRVNYQDDETDESERALAKELGVTYQHTKFIFKDGKEVVRSGDPWDTKRFLEAIDSVTE